jgi:hypothetical protein
VGSFIGGENQGTGENHRPGFIHVSLQVFDNAHKKVVNIHLYLHAFWENMQVKAQMTVTNACILFN